MARSFPESIKKFGFQWVIVCVMTGFFLLFVLGFEPRRLCELLGTGQGHYRMDDMFAFNLSISCAIVFVCMVALRCIFIGFRKSLTTSMRVYCIWCLAEMVVTSAFLALFYNLMAMRDPASGNYFWHLGTTMGAYIPLAAIPYVTMTLIYMLGDAQSAQPLQDDARIRFYDNRHLLKFATTVASVLYIEAEENYICIHYLENGTPRKTQIRATMKSMETICERSGFLRIHRSYIVNPKHVVQLTKDPDGFFSAVIDNDAKILPVSRKYQKSLEALV